MCLFFFVYTTTIFSQTTNQTTHMQNTVEYRKYMAARENLRATNAFANNNQRIGAMTFKDFEILDNFETVLVDISREHMEENGFGCIQRAFMDLDNPRKAAWEYALQRVQVSLLLMTQGSAEEDQKKLKKIESMLREDKHVKEYPKFTAKLFDESSNCKKKDIIIISNLESAAIELDCANGMRGPNDADDAIVEAIDAFLAVLVAKNE
jgi:hypothetical protein